MHIKHDKGFTLGLSFVDAGVTAPELAGGVDSFLGGEGDQEISLPDGLPHRALPVHIQSLGPGWHRQLLPPLLPSVHLPFPGGILGDQQNICFYC